ncbi:hypothetical protein EVAR_73998_1, partial [Eumeta japonica]
ECPASLNGMACTTLKWVCEHGSNCDNHIADKLAQKGRLST